MTIKALNKRETRGFNTIMIKSLNKKPLKNLRKMYLEISSAFKQVLKILFRRRKKYTPITRKTSKVARELTSVMMIVNRKAPKTMARKNITITAVEALREDNNRQMIII